MGRDVAATQFSRGGPDAVPAEGPALPGRASSGCWRSRSSTSTEPLTGVEIELNLVDETGDPAMRNAEVLDAVSRRRLPDRARPVQHRDQRAAAAAGRRVGRRARAERPGHPQPRRGARPTPTGARLVMVGILPTLREPSSCAATPVRQPAVRRCSTSRSSPPAARTCRSPSTASSGCAPTRTRSRPRRPAPASSSTCRSARTQFARVLERRPGDRRRPGRARRQLAVPVRQGAVAGDPDPAVRAGHRHPLRGAEGPGRTAPGLVRRALDHLDLRPVRGERRATSRRCCRCASDEDPARRWTAATSRSWPS